MTVKRKLVLIALRKDYRRYALRMCWEFERRGLNTKLAGDVPSLLAAEREMTPDAVILDAAITQPRTRDVLENLSDRLSSNTMRLVLVDLPSEEEADIRERWPNVDIVV